MNLEVNYDRVAPDYDAHRTGGGPFVPTLLDLARSCAPRRVLEVGAGTGNNTAVFTAGCSSRVIGLDQSAGMLEQAQAKAIEALWVRGDIEAIPLKDGAADFVFGVCVLHHLDRLDKAFGECRRVLRKGKAAFVTSPHDYIDQHPMNAYFPSFAKVDKARFQTVEAIAQALREAGFINIGTKRDKTAPVPVNRAYADRVAGHYISTFALVPRDEFEAGLKRLYADLEERGQLDAWIGWEPVTVWGSNA